MAGGGMGAAAPTQSAQQSGQPTGFSGVFGDGSTPGTIMQGTGLPPQGGMMGIGGGQLYTGGYGLPMTSPAQQAPVGAPPPADLNAAAPAAASAAPSLQFGTAGVGTGIDSAAASPMAQQMQAPASMQNPYARPMAQQMYRSQMMQPQQQMGQYSGLQSLLANLVNRYQQPQQRYSQMPQYQSRALGYRPNMASAQQNLSRVAPSVELQKRQAEEELAAMDPISRSLRGVRNIFGDGNNSNGG